MIVNSQVAVHCSRGTSALEVYLSACCGYRLSLYALHRSAAPSQVHFKRLKSQGRQFWSLDSVFEVFGQRPRHCLVQCRRNCHNTLAPAARSNRLYAPCPVLAHHESLRLKGEFQNNIHKQAETCSRINVIRSGAPDMRSKDGYRKRYLPKRNSELTRLRWKGGPSRSLASQVGRVT